MEIPALFNGPRLRLFWQLLGVGLGQAAAAIIATLLVSRAFDAWLTSAGFVLNGRTLTLVLGLLTLALLAGWLKWQERVLAERLGQDYIYTVRMALFKRLSTLAPRTLQQRSRGGSLLRFIGDLTALRQWVSLGLVRLGVAVLTASGAITALALLNNYLAAAVGLLFFGGGTLAIWLGRPMQAVVRESRRRRSRLAANVDEKIAAMPVVQVFDQIQRERKRLARQSDRLRSAMVARADIIGRLRAVTETISGVAILAVLLLGAAEVSAGRSSAGTVVAAMTLLGMLLPALRDLSRVHEYWHSYRVALNNIQSFMQTPNLVCEEHTTNALPAGPGRIEFHGVTLPGIFEPLDVQAEAGSCIAVVGPNGAGKSTLLSLVARLLDPEQGHISIDGHNLRHCSLSSVRRAIGTVSPDLPLLRGSLERNLRYRWPQASSDELAHVCQLCGVDELLAELPKGLETRINDGGLNLSLGQRQRIALARALLGQPRVLLLDEADGPLDPASAALLDRILQQYQGTVLLVTHRLERVLRADQVWHLAAGRLIETGPPAQLMVRNGPTQRLFTGLQAA